MKMKFLCCALVALLAGLALSATAEGQRRNRRQQRGAVCFDPTVPCRTTATFEAHDLPFRIPPKAVIWESEPFYAIILNSVRFTDANCETSFIPETQRQATQSLFPHNKVFASRCAFPGNLYYTGANPNANFMAVYAGRTQTEAARMLSKIKATGQFANAYIRRLTAGFNGT